MVLLPAQVVGAARIMRLKEDLAHELVRRAIKEDGGKPSDYCVYDWVVGDDSSDASLGTHGFIHNGVKTEQTDNMQYWAEDAADITAGDWCDILTAGEEVDAHTWVGVYGAVDCAPTPMHKQGLEKHATTVSAAPLGALSRIALRKGGSVTKDVWDFSPMYGFVNTWGCASGISPQPVIFNAGEKITPQMAFTMADYDQHVALRGLVCDRWKNITDGAYDRVMGKRPDSEFGRMWADPIQEVTPEYYYGIVDTVWNNLLSFVKNKDEKYIVRSLVIGDESDVTSPNFVDLDFGTAGVTGQDHWQQDAGELTALQPSNILAAAEKVNDNAFLSIYGLMDRTPFGDLDSTHFFHGGSQRVGFWHTQVAMAHRIPMVIAQTPMYWREKDPIGIYANHRTDFDKAVNYLGLIAEPVNDHIQAAN